MQYRTIRQAVLAASQQTLFYQRPQRQKRDMLLDLLRGRQETQRDIMYLYNVCDRAETD